MQTVKLENRAWRGTRLESDVFIFESVPYQISIDYHHPKQSYFLQIDWKPKGTWLRKDTIFLQSIEALLNYAELRFNQKFVCTDPLIRGESHD